MRKCHAVFLHRFSNYAITNYIGALRDLNLQPLTIQSNGFFAFIAHVITHHTGIFNIGYSLLILKMAKIYLLHKCVFLENLVLYTILIIIYFKYHLISSKPHK